MVSVIWFGHAVVERGTPGSWLLVKFFVVGDQVAALVAELHALGAGARTTPTRATSASPASSAAQFSER